MTAKSGERVFDDFCVTCEFTATRQCASNMVKTQEQVNAEWDKAAADWDKNDGGPRVYAASIFPLIWSATQTDKKKAATLKVLDFGCGTGILTESLQKVCGSVVSVDAAGKMVDQVKGKIQKHEWDNVTAINAILSSEYLNTVQKSDDSALKSALEPESFDLIICSSVLTFIPNVEKTVSVLRTLLKPGTGMLFHSDWLAEEKTAEADRNATHKDGDSHASETHAANDGESSNGAPADLERESTSHEDASKPSKGDPVGTFSEASARQMYKDCGLVAHATKPITMEMMGHKMGVLIGVARRP